MLLFNAVCICRYKQFTSAVPLTAVEGDLHCGSLSFFLSLQSMRMLMFTEWLLMDKYRVC